MILPSLSLLLFAMSFVMDRPTGETAATNSTLSGIMPANHNPLTSHVLDTALGRPAAGVNVTLFKQENGMWRKISEQLTNSDGRVGNIISEEEFTPTMYKINFNTLSYYESRGEKTFYPYIDVVFEIERPEEHYHVPIILTTFKQELSLEKDFEDFHTEMYLPGYTQLHGSIQHLLGAITNQTLRELKCVHCPAL